MTGTLPVPIGPIAPRGGEVAGPLADAIEKFAVVAIDALGEAAGDPDALVVARWNLDRSVRLLRLVVAEADRLIVDAVGVGGRWTVEGVDTVEVHAGAPKREWRSEGLLRAVIRRAVDPEGTGELPAAGEMLERIEAGLRTVLNFGPNTAWRAGNVQKGAPGLRTLGLAPHDWSDEGDVTPPRVTSVRKETT